MAYGALTLAVMQTGKVPGTVWFLLVLAGGTAAKSVLDTTEGIMRLRGKWATLTLDDGSAVPALPTFHPAYLLRTPASKRQSWWDLLAIDKKLRELTPPA